MENIGMEPKQEKMVVVGIEIKFNLADVVSWKPKNGMNAAEQMVFWGKVMADAEQEHKVLYAIYRKWKAETGMDHLAGNEKLAEWKVKQAIESDERYLEHKKAIAQAARNSMLARVVYDTLKANGGQDTETTGQLS
jgi:hypothetical protein